MGECSRLGPAGLHRPIAIAGLLQILLLPFEQLIQCLNRGKAVDVHLPQLLDQRARLGEQGSLLRAVRVDAHGPAGKRGLFRDDQGLGLRRMAGRRGLGDALDGLTSCDVNLAGGIVASGPPLDALRREIEDIAIVIIAAVTLLGENLSKTFSSVASEMPS